MSLRTPTPRWFGTLCFVKVSTLHGSNFVLISIWIRFVLFCIRWRWLRSGDIFVRHFVRIFCLAARVPLPESTGRPDSHLDGRLKQKVRNFPPSPLTRIAAHSRLPLLYSVSRSINSAHPQNPNKSEIRLFCPKLRIESIWMLPLPPFFPLALFTAPLEHLIRTTGIGFVCRHLSAQLPIFSFAEVS